METEKTFVINLPLFSVGFKNYIVLAVDLLVIAAILLQRSKTALSMLKLLLILIIEGFEALNETLKDIKNKFIYENCGEY